MKNTLLFFLLSALLASAAACDRPGSGAGQPSADARFLLTPPSLIYFKNIRQSQYERQEHPNRQATVLKLRKLERVQDQPQLLPLIVIDEVKTEGYIFFEKNGALDSFPGEQAVRWRQDTAWQSQPLTSLTLGKQYELADRLYQKLMHREAVEVGSEAGGWHPLYAAADERTGVLVTLRDYFELVEKDRKEKQLK